MTWHRAALVSLASSLAATSLLAIGPGGTAQAAPAFIDDETRLYVFAYSSGGEIGPTCEVDDPSMSPDGVPVVENGSVGTSSASTTIALTYGGSPAGSMSMSATGSASATSAGGVLRTISLQVSAQGTSTVATKPDCIPNMQAVANLEYGFRLPVSGVLEIHTSSTEGSGGRFQLRGAGAPPSQNDQGYLLPADQTLRLFLPAGEYNGEATGSFRLRSDHPALNRGSVGVQATFTPAGAQTEAASGKATKYLTLPGAVACGTGLLSPMLTTKKKRAAKIRQVAYYVGDQLLTKDKHPKKGEVANLPVAGPSASTLRAVVTLHPRSRGRKPKVLEATASYEACS